MRMCFSYNGTYDNLCTGQHRKKSSTIKILTLPDLVFPMTSYGELLQDCDAARSEEVLVGGRVDEPRVGVAVHERVDLQLRLVERVLRLDGMFKVMGNRSEFSSAEFRSSFVHCTYNKSAKDKHNLNDFRRRKGLLP